MELQKFAYCVKTSLGYDIATMRFSKRESIKAYMDKTFPDSNIVWSNLTHSPTRSCVKVELILLTQTNK